MGFVFGGIVLWAGNRRVLDPLREEAVGPRQTPECALTKNKRKASLSLFAMLRICHLWISKHLRHFETPQHLHGVQYPDL